jgi:hypothetical protein
MYELSRVCNRCKTRARVDDDRQIPDDWVRAELQTPGHQIARVDLCQKCRDAMHRFLRMPAEKIRS